MDIFLDLHEGLTRLGPGDEDCTARALSRLEPPQDGLVLDMGCGTGGQTLALARLLPRALIVATDLYRRFLRSCPVRARARGFGGSVACVVADMAAMPFPPGSFDLVWSEGAIYNIGFDTGLAVCRDLLKPGGLVGVSELTWTGEDRPGHIRDYWAANYPGMRDVMANLRGMSAAGIEPQDWFVLPESAWWDGYYRELEARLTERAAFLEADPAGRYVAEECRREMALFARHSASYNYVFYLGRRV